MRYSVRSCSVFSFRAQSQIIPLDKLNNLCSEILIGKLYNWLSFKRFSVWHLAFLSASSMLSLNFLTVFTVPIRPWMCLSITKGDKDVINFSLVDFTVRNNGKFS